MSFFERLAQKAILGKLGGRIATVVVSAIVGAGAVVLDKNPDAFDKYKIANAVDTYCEGKENKREQFRREVNEQLAPHSVAVFCAGDSTP